MGEGLRGCDPVFGDIGEHFVKQVQKIILIFDDVEPLREPLTVLFVPREVLEDLRVVWNAFAVIFEILFRRGTNNLRRE